MLTQKAHRAVLATITSSLLALTTGPAMAATSETSKSNTFSARLKTPRIAPIPKEGRTEEQIAMLKSRPDYNLYTTLAHHVELYNRWSPLGQYLLNASKLPPRDREMIMLRMGWLCQAEYEWAQHARIAKGDPGLTAQEIHRIAEGAEAKGWTDFERTLLRMVDELRYDTKISDATWNALRAKYSMEQTIDALYTAAQYQLVSMVLNSTGIQLDAILDDRLPHDVPMPHLAGAPTSERLQKPRIKPLSLNELTPEQRAIIAGQVTDGKVMNLYATMINHPSLYTPRSKFGSYLQRDSHLPPQTRELLIMRTAYIVKAEYEWAHHVSFAKTAGLSDEDVARIAKGPDAAGWSEEQAALLRAVDELRREAFISDRTWNTLAKYYDPKLLLEIIYTTGGYTMTGLAINSFGVQIEPGFPAFPKH